MAQAIITVVFGWVTRTREFLMLLQDRVMVMEAMDTEGMASEKINRSSVTTLAMVLLCMLLTSRIIMFSTILMGIITSNPVDMCTGRGGIR